MTVLPRCFRLAIARSKPITGKFFGAGRVVRQWLKDRDRLVEEGLALIQAAYVGILVNVMFNFIFGAL